MNLDKLKGLMVEKHVSKPELAAELGYSVQNLNNKLLGKTKIYVDEVPVICRYLDITDEKLKCEIFLT